MASLEDPRRDNSGPATLEPPSPAGSRPAAGLPLLPTDPANQQRAVAALFIAVLSLAGLAGLNDFSRGIYVALFALLAGAVALWLSIGSIVRARRGRTKLPHGSVSAIVIAGVGIVLSGLIALTFVLLGPQLSSYGRCLSGANTISARQACQTQFSHAISRKLAAIHSVGNP